MPLTIKNWKLTLLALLFICLFLGLGFWQLVRAKQKEALLKSFAERTEKSPLQTNDLKTTKDLRFYSVQLRGTLDNPHTLLLDNKTYHGQVGYEVYTPMKVAGLAMFILVDRGFVPIGRNRQTLPVLREAPHEVAITGMLNRPPAYVAFGSMTESPQIHWPLRVEYINLQALATLFNYPLFPYVINISPAHTAAFAVEWQIVSMGPERHYGYAVQWFALALTLLIISIALNRQHSS